MTLATLTPVDLACRACAGTRRDCLLGRSLLASRGGERGPLYLRGVASTRRQTALAWRGGRNIVLCLDTLEDDDR